MSIAVQVERLSKHYHITHETREPYLTLRDTVVRAGVRLARGTASLFKEAGPDRARATDFWALSDVSFDVEKATTVGIIGRNGAGKSTLLKILSRITEPTRGRVRLRGRVASLLEVGTGFHHELTGRENLFLNGAILGMSRAEISRKFDEIVAFAGVERFLDTPVKRYSSGMQVRLAFAIAAHLEPEILIVDEVLAVGDFDFQTRCIRRMENVARSGATVLFVSHNLSAVQRLCTRALLLRQGELVADGPTNAVIEEYLRDGTEEASERIWAPADAPAFEDGSVRLRAIRSLDLTGELRTAFDVSEPILIEVDFDVVEPKHALNVHLYLTDGTGQPIFVTMDGPDAPWRSSSETPARYRGRVRIPAHLLNEGRLRIEYLICCKPHHGLHVTVPDALTLEVLDQRSEGGARGDWSSTWPEAAVRPMLQWEYSLR